MENIEILYQEYAQFVYRYIFALTRNHDLSEDLTQETFCQAIQSIGKFQGNSKITTWLCAIAKNQLMKYYQKHKICEEWEMVIIGTPSVEDIVIEKENWNDLIGHLKKCPEPYRQIFTLRWFGDFSFREIGTILGKSENWARVTYYRGKEKMRKEIRYGNE